ncbi:gas vesicle protein [Streptomyces odonnellii]|uniref:gas vesicle protein n=1 Tax=Streptomyces odonnellii TaxID=1417980 RepID=UPI000626720E
MTHSPRPATQPVDRRPWADDDAHPLAGRQIALIDLLDRLLTGGVVLTGDLTLSIADVDLVRISLRALIVSIRTEQRSLEASAAGRRPGEVTGTAP